MSTTAPLSPPETDQWAALLTQTTPPADFSFVQFERVNVEENAARYYLIAWLPTLLGWGVVRVWGRKGESQHLRTDPFPSLTEAWPAIQGHIRTRLRHGYRIVSSKIG